MGQEHFAPGTRLLCISILISANGKPQYQLSNYLMFSYTTPTYWKSIIINLKSFIYVVLWTLHKEGLVDGEAGKNSNLGTEIQ